MLKDSTENKLLYDEYEFLRQARVLIKDQSTINNYVDVPKLYWLVPDSAWINYIVMDFIEWKTLYNIFLRNAIIVIYQEYSQIMKHKENYLDISLKYAWIISACESNTFLKDKNLEIAFEDLCIEFENQDPDNQLFKTIWSRWTFYEMKTNKKLFAWKRKEMHYTQIAWNIAKSRLHTYDKRKRKIDQPLIDCISLFNKNNIYHNDLTSRNIIFGDDKKLYLIDYGLATSQPKTSTALMRKMEPASSRNTPNPMLYLWNSIEWDYKCLSLLDKFWDSTLII